MYFSARYDAIGRIGCMAIVEFKLSSQFSLNNREAALMIYIYIYISYKYWQDQYSVPRFNQGFMKICLL